MNIVFFIRAYNDIDTVVPVAYKLLKTKAADSVCIVNQGLREDHERDFRIEFLRTVGEVRYVDAAGRSGLNPCCGKYDLRELSRRWRPASVLYNRLVLPVVESRRQEALDGFDFSSLPLAPGEPTVFLFDYNNSTLTRRGCEFARSKGFATGFLPHGLRTVDSRWLQIQKQESCAKGSDAGGGPDVFFSNNANFSSSLSPESADKVREVGAPRYCREWSGILDEITPQVELPQPGRETVRVCVMLSKWHFGSVWKEAALWTIRRLAAQKDYFVIVKPNPRGMEIGRELAGCDNLLLADGSHHSRRLIQWADVTVFWKSSVFLDAMLLDKPLLHMHYGTSSRLACADIVSGWNVNSREDTLDWIERFREDRATRTYSAEERKACLDFYVDDANGDVLSRHVDEIVEMARGAKTW